MKKVLSLLLSLVMVISLVSTVNLCVYAEENDTDIVEDITNPEEPTDPVDPEEPTDPVDPEEPTNPVDPEEPTDPVDPEEPTDPVDPEEPTDPVAPGEPTDPVAPEEPTDPVAPGEPTDPVAPEEPTDPVAPGEPTDPVDPEEPTNPVDPEEPTNPVDPEEPTEPEEPEKPTDPVDPEEPVKLDTPIAELIVNDNGTFTIRWNEVAGADKYEIYIFNNSTGDYQLNGTVAKTSAATAVAPYGVKYSYKVRAINSENADIASDFSEVVTGVNNKKLAAPKLKVTENKNGTFTLYWNAVAGAEKYELCIKQPDGSYNLMKTTNLTSFTTAVGAYGYNYAYKMRAVTSKNVDAVSDYSAVVGAVNNFVLSTPSMKAAINSNGTFTLSWGRISGADKYELYIRQPNGSYNLMKTTNALSFTTAMGAYGYKYSYKMRAVNSKNSSLTSAYSSVISATNNKKLQTPSIKVTVNANGTFKLSWNKISGADKYELYIRQTNGSYKLMKTTTSASFTTAVGSYGYKYSYKMRAVNSKYSSVASAYSSVVSAVNNKKLQTPGGVKVAMNKNGSFTISWNKVYGASSYQIYIKQTNGAYKLMKTTSATSFTTAVATKGRNYSYKVRALTNKNSSATSAFSSVVSKKR